MFSTVAFAIWHSCDIAILWPRLRLTALMAVTAAFVVLVEAGQRVPSMPRNVDVTQINASSIRVAWEQPENEGESPIFGYNVYKDRQVNGHSANNIHKAVASVDRNKLYTFIDDLEPNSEYVIRVAAVNEFGDGERSPIKRIVTGGRPPSAPRPQSIQPQEDEHHALRARIEWLPPAHTYNLPVLKYVLRYRPFEQNTAESVEIDASRTSHVLESLHYGQLYELQIAALNEAGLSEYATEQFLTPDGQPDGEPLNVRYTIFKNQLSILWDPPLWLHRNGNITHYRVVFKGIQGRNSGQNVEQNVTSQFIAFEVDSKTSYTFKVAAATTKGYGPYSPTLTINADINTSIGPPTNVRVQAITNTSVVVQWDFDEVANDGFADGFVVRFMHEPSSSLSTGSESERGRSKIYAQEKWRSQQIMDTKARHLEIARLFPQKSYAFCVLAIKQSRLGPCSDPPVTLDRLRPIFIVQNLHIQYKTSQSVAFQWEYTGSSSNIGFYIKHSGVKTYQDQFLEEKHLESPGFEKKVDGVERQFLWQNLRPYMNYTFQVGVYSLDDDRMYWPRELHVQTDPTGPPFVDAPEFIQSPSSTTAHIRLNCASEEYGPIDHYWLIVVPSNYTKEDIVNIDSIHLQHSTTRLRALRSGLTGGGSTTIAGGAISSTNLRAVADVSSQQLDRLPRSRRAIIARPLDGVYITAQLSTHFMQRLYREERTFTLGDGKEYDGYMNMPLDPNLKYSLMTRAFTRDDKWRHSEHPFEQRPPMQEPASRLFSDSILTESFSTRTSLFSSSTVGGSSRGNGSIIWLAGPAIVIFVLLIIVGMLVALWWSRGAKSRAKFRGNPPHGISINAGNATMTKVALSGSDFHNNNNPATLNNTTTLGLIPNETSKLLLSMDADGRPIINAYERPVIPALSDSNTMLNHLQVFPDGSSPLGATATLKQNGTPAYVSGGIGGIVTVSAPSGVRYIAPPPLAMDGAVNDGYSNTTPIPLAEFATHIDKLKMNNNALFNQEYESIETGQHFTWENSLLEVNKHKNRYANVVAYDHSRVILTPLEDNNGETISGSDYINANYIDGYDVPRAYIATQGPLPETFADFWRMIWEERSGTIVMLTRLEERQRTKCDQYWPSRGSSIYGFFRVALLETTELAHYCIRTMRVEDTRTREHRDIQHAQFTAWPDHGVPHHPTPFLMFLKRIKALNPPNAGPIITHCSAGVGRTGAFIVIDCMLDRLRNEYTVDIYGCVKAVRAQRSYMVQTDEQYIFIHDAVLDAAQSGSTEVPSSRLAQHIQILTHQRHAKDATGMEIEFGTLVTLRTSDSKCQIALLPFNIGKNRQSDVIPYDWNRVELIPIDGIDGTDYINASWIDGYRSRNEYIATQAPLQNTVSDFWRMIWEQECCIVAMLAQPHGENYHVYWPMERREAIDGLIVDCVTEFDMSHYILREFKLTHSATGKSRTVRQFHFIEWPTGDVPYYVDRFVDYVRQVHQTKTQFGAKGPICVHCSDGAGRTGVFITASIVIERIKLERAVDIFTTVKLLRMQRPNMIETREQYEFCYKAGVQFLSSFEEPL